MHKHSQLTETLAAMPDEHLECRDFGHSWKPFTATWNRQERAYRVELRCTRCHTIRVRLLDKTGALLTNHYQYPDGYLVKGLGRLTGTDRDAVRLASVQHLIQRPQKASA